MRALLRTMAEAARAAAGLLLPRRCAVCGGRLETGERAVCAACTLRLPYTRFGPRRGNPVERLLMGRFPLGRASAYIFYLRGAESRMLLFSLKYYRRYDVGVELGRRMAERMLGGGFFEGVDTIVPVPLSRRRERRRGYNQSLALARGVAAVTGLPVENGLLRRMVDNPTQTLRTPRERIENVTGIFRARRPGRIAGRHLLLVDDVVTTGATVTACADELVRVGARTVSVLALAAAKAVERW